MNHKGHFISWHPVTSRDEFLEYGIEVDGECYATYDTMEDVQSAIGAIMDLIDRDQWQSSRRFQKSR